MSRNWILLFPVFLFSCHFQPGPGGKSAAEKFPPPGLYKDFLLQFCSSPSGETNHAGDSACTTPFTSSDSIFLPFIRSIHAEKILSGKDTLVDIPFFLRHPEIDAGMMQNATGTIWPGKSFGRLLVKDSAFDIVEINWGENELSFIASFSKKGKFIDAFPARLETTPGGDTITFSRETFFRCEEKKFDVWQKSRSPFYGETDFHAWLSCTADGHFHTDTVINRIDAEHWHADAESDDPPARVTAYDGFELNVPLGKIWCSYKLDEDYAIQFQYASVDTMQIDGKGHKELIIDEHRETEHYASGSGWGSSYARKFIWNPDTKSVMFDACYRDVDEENTPVDDTTTEESEASYSYAIHISPGMIVIDSLRAIEDGPDHDPGKYVIRNGVFVMK